MTNYKFDLCITADAALRSSDDVLVLADCGAEDLQVVRQLGGQGTLDQAEDAVLLQFWNHHLNTFLSVSFHNWFLDRLADQIIVTKEEVFLLPSFAAVVLSHPSLARGEVPRSSS